MLVVITKNERKKKGEGRDTKKTSDVSAIFLYLKVR